MDNTKNAPDLIASAPGRARTRCRVACLPLKRYPWHHKARTVPDQIPQENKKAHIALTRATRTEVAAGLVAPARPAVSKAARANRPAAAAAYSRPLDMLLYPNKTATQSPHETLVRCAQGWRLRLASSWCRKSSAPASSSTRRQLSLILAAPTRFHSVLRLRRSRERHARGYAMRRSGSRR